MMQFEFLLSLLKACKKNKINTIVDTCGYAETERFKKIYNLVDLFLYDIKIIDWSGMYPATNLSGYMDLWLCLAIYR